MCGRFTRHLTWSQIHDLYRITEGAALNVPARSDIRPTTDVLIVRRTAMGREAKNVRWGLVPPYFKTPDVKKFINHNARTDKIASGMKWWRQPFDAGRSCLIPASGYYEWKAVSDAPKAKKQRYYFTARSGAPLAFAGLWETNAEFGESATMITTEPNAVAAEIHDRMPVILAPEAWDEWLAKPSLDLLRPCPDDDLIAAPVRSDIKDEDTADTFAGAG